ncbi:MAG: ClbS/DfsB family four-helix bundle protein [Candidatus Rokubacteria bacterium]|nr:ClbS/DfsB family four-helix bundle protein [Candidatus Rokubacteria bacterium]
MSPKNALLSQAQDEFRAFKAALGGLDERQLAEVWLGSWSIKDILAHISGWHREMGPGLERLARGEKPFSEGTNYNDVDSWNARFAAAKKNATGSELLGELDASHDSFMAQAAKVPEERFVPGKTAHRIVDLNSAHHYKEHGDQIRAWRQDKGI